MRFRASLPIAVAFLAACSVEPPEVASIALGSPQGSELSFQAVDAGTGAELTDGQMTVRYLVRAPVTLDASGVERVSSREPFSVQQEVAEENLVVEVRLEADSYHRLDTVLMVPRGGTGGPFTLRMSRKLGGQTAAGGSSRPAAGRPTTAQPASAQPTTSQPAAGAAAIDRAPMLAGNQAFARGDWSAAVQAYERMPEPRDRSSAYADEYRDARVNQGIAAINRGERATALDALEEALTFDDVGYQAYLRAAQVQCEVGRGGEARGTLAILDREVNRMPPADRPMIRALRHYYEGLCAEQEFDAASGSARISAGAAAIRAYEAFAEAGAEVSPISAELQTALDDAQNRIAGIRQRIRG